MNNKKYLREYYQKNKEEIKRKSRQYRLNNKKKIKEYRKLYKQKNREKILEYGRNYRKNNKEKANKYHRERGKTDIKFRLNRNTTNAIGRSLKQKKAGRKWETLVGYTLQDLMKRLEYQFDENMNWNNYGSYWEIDHIKPKSLFNIEDFKMAWALGNLQPLEVHKNRVKHNNY